MRFFLTILLTVVLSASFVQATEPSFKFTFGATLGSVPLQINKISKNEKNVGGLKINSWSLSPNFSSFNNDKQTVNFTEKLEENLYIKINFKF